MGIAEKAMRHMLGYYKATVGDAGASSMEPLKSLRAGDIESPCRYVLMQHPNLSSHCAFSVISWTGRSSAISAA